MEKPLKITVIGDDGIGKTSLLIRHTSGEFIDEYVPSIFESYPRHFNFEGKDVIYQPWDTSNAEDDEYNIKNAAYSHVSIFFLCFSVVNRVSFENIERMYITEIKDENKGTPILLIGTCSDLMNTSGKDMNELILQEEGEEKARKIGAIEYIECSSKENINIDKIFDTAIIYVMTHRKGKCNIF